VAFLLSSLLPEGDTRPSAFATLDSPWTTLTTRHQQDGNRRGRSHRDQRTAEPAPLRMAQAF
jgi:hypothetical protein